MWVLYGIGFACALAVSLFLTPLVRKLALLIGAVDKPNERKVHTKLMPRLGGLAIYLGFILGMFVVYPAITGIDGKLIWGIVAGGSVVVLVGVLDDRFELSPKLKLLGQIAAALVVMSFGLDIEIVHLPCRAGGRAGLVQLPADALLDRRDHQCDQSDRRSRRAGQRRIRHRDDRDPGAGAHDGQCDGRVDLCGPAWSDRRIHVL